MRLGQVEREHKEARREPHGDIFRPTDRAISEAGMTSHNLDHER